MEGYQMESAIVRMSDITKSFNHVTVLKKVNFELYPGEVHALLGENGAGKSTLMKILRGIYQPDSGEIRIQEKVVHLNTTSDALNNGVAMVFQEFSQVPTLTVAQNIFLTREFRSRLNLLDDHQCEIRAKEIFDDMGVDIDPKQLLSNLSTGYRQLTEIAKALSQNARILILDEPTASLTETETQALFSLIRRLKKNGISIIYISHRMEEIFKISDRITILRDGQKIVTEEAKNLNIQQVIEHIIGQKKQESKEIPVSRDENDQQVLLEINHLECEHGVHDVSLKLHCGEVLGIAGLMGNGQSELMQAIFGMNPIRAGEILIRDKKVKITDPAMSMKAGIAMIPEDRRNKGLILMHTIRENIMMPMIKLNRLPRRKFFIDEKKGSQVVNHYVKRLNIRCDSIYKQVGLLSGGNQQKVVIAKWLSTNPDILLMDEPTVGVDIGAKQEIIDIMRALAKEGKGVIFITSELKEMLSVCNRIMIIQNGHITRELKNSEIQSEERLNQILQGA
jgi:ribose transport system ATP-binding protein